MSSRVKSLFFVRIKSKTVGIVPLACRLAVESALGSQPICMTLSPLSARAAARLLTVVDLPMPPLP